MTQRFTVVDTNVLIAASGRSDQASTACIEACIDELIGVRRERQLALDAAGEILEEHSRHCHYRGQPGVGDEFFRWAQDNRYTECHLVELTPNADRVYEEFPNVADLRSFDRADRKFVATALTCNPTADVVNALDSDWRDVASALAAAGLSVRELCPECIP